VPVVSSRVVLAVALAATGLVATARAQQAAPPQGDEVRPMEVVVQGDDTPSGATSSVTRRTAQGTPGSFGDPLRVVETTPGVVPLQSGLPFFFVRGAPPGNVGFYLDGIRIPLLYHALLGPSVVHPGLIQGVELYSGAAPSRFGRSAGAIVSAETRPPLPKLNGEGNLRVFDVGALVETPVLDGRGSVMAAGRYSYTALIASLLSGAELDYWDWSTRASYRLDATQSLSVFGFGAYDFFQDSGSLGQGAVQFHRVDLRYDRDTLRSHLRLATTVGWDRTSTNEGSLQDSLARLRAEYVRELRTGVTLSAGGDAQVDRYRVRTEPDASSAVDVQRLFPERVDLTGGAYAQLDWDASRQIRLSPGARADVYRVLDQTLTSEDVRVVASFRPNAWLRTEQTLGVAHQLPSFVPQIPAAQVGARDAVMQRAIQASSAVKVALPSYFEVGATAFRVQYHDLTDPIGSQHDLQVDATVLDERTDGDTVGLELLVRRRFGHGIGGFIAYTLSRSVRNTARASMISAYDRPHVLQAALAVPFLQHWQAGARLAAWSGIPARELGAIAGQDSFSGADRASPFARLDLRLERRWRLGSAGWWALVAEVMNATGAKETTSRTCSPARCVDEWSGPITIPSLGLEIYYY